MQPNLKLYVWESHELGTSRSGILFTLAHDIEEAKNEARKTMAPCKRVEDALERMPKIHTDVCAYGRWGTD